MEKIKDVTFIFDIDGTICPIKKSTEKYDELIPFEEVVKKIRKYHELGAKIVLFTSRNMKTFQGNIGLINANTAKVLLKWLEKWSIPYDEIIYGKPWPGSFGFYVDDRAIRPREFLDNKIEDIQKICEKDRIEL